MAAALAFRRLRQASISVYRSNSVVARRFASFDVRSLASQRLQLVTLRHIYDACDTRPLTIAPWLHRQLPLRIARVIVLLLDAPPALASQLPFKRALDAYSYMEEQLVSVEECTRTDGQPTDAFADLIDRIYCVNHDAMRLIAQAVQQQQQKLDYSAFLSDFFHHRVRLRTLCGQASALFNSLDATRRTRATDDGNSSDYSPKDTGATNLVDSDTGQIGALQRRTLVSDCLSDAAAASGDVCLRTFGIAPEVDIVGDNTASLLYMPDHLFGVFFELLKNSMRAVCERHGDATHKLPPVGVRVCNGAQDITIAIDDKGAGFSSACLPDMFRFYYSTAASRINVGDDAVSIYHSGSRSNAMAGHGYGLPLARINVRSFGGDIILAPIQGAGCTAFVYLHKNSEAVF